LLPTESSCRIRPLSTMLQVSNPLHPDTRDSTCAPRHALGRRLHAPSTCREQGSMPRLHVARRAHSRRGGGLHVARRARRREGGLPVGVVWETGSGLLAGQAELVQHQVGIQVPAPAAECHVSTPLQRPEGSSGRGGGSDARLAGSRAVGSSGEGASAGQHLSMGVPTVRQISTPAPSCIFMPFTTCGGARAAMAVAPRLLRGAGRRCMQALNPHNIAGSALGAAVMRAPTPPSHLHDVGHVYGCARAPSGQHNRTLVIGRIACIAAVVMGAAGASVSVTGLCGVPRSRPRLAIENSKNTPAAAKTKSSSRVMPMGSNAAVILKKAASPGRLTVVTSRYPVVDLGSSLQANPAAASGPLVCCNCRSCHLLAMCSRCLS